MKGDPKRPESISSTDDEQKAAIVKACSIKEYMAKHGWADPVVCDSGNGASLLYHIDLPNTDKNTDYAMEGTPETAYSIDLIHHLQLCFRCQIKCMTRRLTADIAHRAKYISTNDFRKKSIYNKIKFIDIYSYISLITSVYRDSLFLNLYMFDLNFYNFYFGELV